MVARLNHMTAYVYTKVKEKLSGHIGHVLLENVTKHWQGKTKLKVLKTTKIAQSSTGLNTQPALEPENPN